MTADCRTGPGRGGDRRRDGGSQPAAPVTRTPDSPEVGETPPPIIGSRPAADQQIDNRLFVLVLQHPQERSEPRATAAAAVAVLRRARLVVGLSWPNLTRALGRPADRPADPGRWGVLYLGAARPQSPQRPLRPDTAKPDTAKPDGRKPNVGTLGVRATGGAIIAVGRDGNPLPDSDRMSDRVRRGLDGIVLLDGTWSQAKTLWWRNPWLLKLHRFVLNPPEPARLGRLRREPRPEALSTLEAAALVLRHVEPDLASADALIAALDRIIAAQTGPPEANTGRGDTGGGDAGRGDTGRGDTGRGDTGRGDAGAGGIDRASTDRGGAGPQDRPGSSPRRRYVRRSARRRDRSAIG